MSLGLGKSGLLINSVKEMSVARDELIAKKLYLLHNMHEALQPLMLEYELTDTITFDDEGILRITLSRSPLSEYTQDFNELHKVVINTTSSEMFDIGQEYNFPIVISFYITEVKASEVTSFLGV